MTKNFFLVFFVLLPFVTQAECKGFWEPTTLKNTKNTHVNLLFEEKTRATIPTQWFQEINNIKTKIDASSGIYTKLFICDSQDPNAFAWTESGLNTVVLTLGMYNLIGNDWGAYAAILGHENAHLVKNHGQKRRHRQMGLKFIQLLAGAALEALLIKETDRSTGLGFDIATIGTSSIHAFYSRDEEREADKHGMIYAHRAGFDPFGAIRLHSKLGGASNFLSSHPSTTDRIAALQLAIADQMSDRTNERLARKDDVLKPIGSGLIVAVKVRHGYYIASQSELTTPTKGIKVHIINGESKRIVGTVERVIGGYFSVLPEAVIDYSILGARVIF